MNKKYKWKMVSFRRSFQGSGPGGGQTGLSIFEMEAWLGLLSTINLPDPFEYLGKVSSYRLRPGSYTTPTTELDVFFKFRFQHLPNIINYGLMLNQDDGSFTSTPLDHFPMLVENTKLDFAEDGWSTRKHLRFRNAGSDPIIANYDEDQNIYVTAG